MEKGNISYTKKLWSQCDMLHDRFKKTYDICINLIELLNRLSNASKDYSKILSTIANKNYKLYLEEESNTSVSKALDAIKQNLYLQSEEFRLASEQIKNDCTTDFQRIVLELAAKEKEKYLEYKRVSAK